MIVREDPDEFDVWLEPEDGDVEVGICVGVGETKMHALSDARDTLEAMLAEVNRRIHTGPTTGQEVKP